MSSQNLTPETLPLAGHQVDVYGLSLLPASCKTVTCIWLHHQRTRTKESMASFASLILSTYYSDSDSKSTSSSRGLLCLAYDHRNHGTREINPHTTGSWREGNPNHAVDMWGMVSGMVADQSLLIDLIESYLFPAAESDGKTIDQHLVLGVSLGGHSTWQAVFTDKRVRGGVAVIGCPDFMYLMSDRARLSKLKTWGSQDGGAAFLGSRDFPTSLVEACKKGDPKGLLFGTGPVENGRPASPTRATQQAGARQRALYERLEGKRLMVCTGQVDKLVPPRCSEPFMSWLKRAVEEPPTEEQRILVDERIYEGVGHVFSEGMIKDAAEFLLGCVRSADEDRCNPLRKEAGWVAAKV